MIPRLQRKCDLFAARPTHVFFFLSVLLLTIAGCSTPHEETPERQQLLQVLEIEMQSGTDWVRVHAADALINHGGSDQVVNFIKPESVEETNVSRVGTWRVLSRCARTPEERDYYRMRLRRTMADPLANDRLQAAESLARLGQVLEVAELREIELWLAEADEATAPYPLWLLILEGNPANRSVNEDRVAALLESSDFCARARAAVVLGRLHSISAQSSLRLGRRLQVEPDESPARVYMITALLLHAKRNSVAAENLKRELSFFLVHGSPDEQMEAAMAIGKCGTIPDQKVLTPLLKSALPDTRIAAANGLLYLLR